MEKRREMEKAAAISRSRSDYRFSRNDDLRKPKASRITKESDTSLIHSAVLSMTLQRAF